MPMELKREEMKSRILNYLDYMNDDDLKEISVNLYTISKRRIDAKIKKDTDMRRERESDASE
mgnify:FL=1|tara:strand:+ start:68 stop:253 length:186 start_codon:yes stop_codon:yes gene_type:complete